MNLIKFRGLTREGGNEIYGDLLHDIEIEGKPVALAITINGSYPQEIYSDWVCQFTGFFDSKRKEIYEDDILGENPLLRGIIKRRKDGQFYFKFFAYQLGELPIDDHKVLNSVVLGNSYLNPDLVIKY